MPLGAIRLREAISPPPDDQAYSAESIALLEKIVAATLAAGSGVQPMPPGGACFGCGGGFSTLGAMVLGKDGKPGAKIPRWEIDSLFHQLCLTPPAETATRYDLPLKRARIMVAGACVASRIMKRLGVDEITISWAGLREGLAARALFGDAAISR